MADVKRIATRASYGEALVELGAEHDDFVVFDADLAAATQTAKFKAAYPDRFFNAGIASQYLGRGARRGERGDGCQDGSCSFGRWSHERRAVGGGDGSDGRFRVLEL